MSHRVVITGMGCITASGNDVPAFWSSVSAGLTSIAPLNTDDCDVRIATGAQIVDFDPASHFTSEELTVMDRFSQFAVLAARQAVRDAGLEVRDTVISRAAGIVGTGCGGKQTDEETYRKLYREGRTRVHPLTIPRGMPSAAASMVSQHIGIKGPVFSVASACASGAHAIIQGAQMIQSGMVDVALVGGADAPFTCGLLKSWEALRAVSQDTCRPFSHDRTGMVLGEGAAMLLLESEGHAKSRGALCHAEIVGFGMTSDAGHITRPDVDGVTAAMSQALRTAGLPPTAIGYINAHGTGTIANDLAETAAINNVFGSQAEALVVSSTKSMHGHALGAASAIEMIATVMALKTGTIPPTANFSRAGEGCNLDYVPNKARALQVEYALSNSFAFGGLNAVLAIRLR